MPSPLEFAAATLIMAVGSAFQAAVGLGLALLVAPFLALIDARFIPGPMLFAGIALTVETAYRDRDEIDWGQLILLAVLASALSPKFAATPRALLAGSTVSGIMGTMAGVHGPAIALVLQNE